MLRVAAAGFQHETNSFAPEGTDLAAFERADSWPALTEGDALPGVMAGLNVPLAGFLAAASDMAVTPVLWAAAEPAGPVTRDAFEAIAGRIADGAAGADAVYLDLHGAMILEDGASGEAELLRLLRARLGDVPIVASLDLHANVPEDLARLATRLVIYRTYPHLDMAATGARCADLLRRHARGPAPAAALRRGGYLIPMPAQWTGAEPARGLYAAAAAAGAELAMGFPAGDVPWCGPSVVAYADTQPEADAAADALAARLAGAEPGFAAHRVPGPAAAVRAALAAPAGPVVIADVADNPGGGGTADTMGLLHELVARGARGAVVLNVHAPETAAAAHAAGQGGRFAARLGARAPWPGDRPYEGAFAVERLSRGPVRYLGEMYGGGAAEIGPSALLRLDRTDCEVRVIVTSIPNQALDRGFLVHFGVDPASQRIVVLKSSVHYRADFGDVAALVLEADAPGRLPADLTALPFARLPPDLRRMPRKAF